MPEPHAWQGNFVRTGIIFPRGLYLSTTAEVPQIVDGIDHRLNSFTADVRRVLVAEQLAAIRGATRAYRSAAEIAEMHKFAEAIIYPKRAANVMQGHVADLATKDAAE